ncbi:hypothetical protein [Mesorhizobium sp. WSM3224]|uniref:hypothetical protein n=1 Tax=Mesorhizobium sp. WSM3224 TaxID=1040986 RepID=UPI00047FEF2E|nr:hypothetical protein [Mesorhizobium sp. WSM3224]
MNHAQSTRSKCLRYDFTFIKRQPLILAHGIRSRARNAMLSLVPLCLGLLLAFPANSQSVVVSEQTGVEKEPSNAPALGEHEEALRRELAAARAELAKQAQALKEQQQTDKALALDLETAQRAIENFRAEASLWDNENAAKLAAHPSEEASQAAAKQALDDERNKLERLEQERNTARQTIDTLRTAANLTAVEQANAIKGREAAEVALKQAGQALELGRQRADSAVRDLEVVRKECDASKQVSAELSAELEEERERAIGLARSLSAARDAIDKVKARDRAAGMEGGRITRNPAGAVSSKLSTSGVQPAHKPDLRRKQKVTVRRPPQSSALATIALPAVLLPTRAPKKRDPRP